MSSPSREELLQTVDDLAAELESVREAKVAADDQLLAAEARVRAVSEELHQNRLERDLQVCQAREAVREEREGLGRWNRQLRRNCTCLW